MLIVVNFFNVYGYFSKNYSMSYLMNYLQFVDDSYKRLLQVFDLHAFFVLNILNCRPEDNDLSIGPVNSRPAKFGGLLLIT